MHGLDVDGVELDPLAGDAHGENGSGQPLALAVRHGDAAADARGALGLAPENGLAHLVPVRDAPRAHENLYHLLDAFILVEALKPDLHGRLVKHVPEAHLQSPSS